MFHQYITSHWGPVINPCHQPDRKISVVIFIGPESDHWLCLSVTHCRLVNLIDVTLACEDAKSKLIEVVTVANFDDEDRVGNTLLQIWKLRFGHKT